MTLNKKGNLFSILAVRLFSSLLPLNTAFGRSRVAKRWQRHQQQPFLPSLPGSVRGPPPSVRPRSYAVFRVKPKPEQTRRRRRDLPRGRRSSSRSTYHHRCHRHCTSQCGPTDCGMSVQGISKRWASGCVKLGEKVAFYLPTAGRKTQFFPPSFSQPGKSLLEGPCRGEEGSLMDFAQHT